MNIKEYAISINFRSMINKQCVPLFIFIYRCWCISIFKLLLLTQHPFYCNIFSELGERASLLTIQRRCPVFTSFQNKNLTTCSYSLECSQTFPETSTDKKMSSYKTFYLEFPFLKILSHLNSQL